MHGRVQKMHRRQRLYSLHANILAATNVFQPTPNAGTLSHARDGRYTCSMDHSHPQEGSDKEESPFIYTFTTWSPIQSAHEGSASSCLPLAWMRQAVSNALTISERIIEGTRVASFASSSKQRSWKAGHEHDLNHLRADLSDDSHEAESESEDEDEADQAPLSRRSSQGWDTQRYAPFQKIKLRQQLSRV